MLTTAQAIGIKLIAALAKRFFVTSGLYARMTALVVDVTAVLTAPGTGAEKKAWVLDRLNNEVGWVQEELEALPSWLVSLVVDIIVSRLKADGVI